MFDPNEQPVDNYVNIDGEWIYFDCPEDFDDYIRMKKLKQIKKRMNGTSI